MQQNLLYHPQEELQNFQIHNMVMNLAFQDNKISISKMDINQN